MRKHTIPPSSVFKNNSDVIEWHAYGYDERTLAKTYRRTYFLNSITACSSEKLNYSNQNDPLIHDDLYIRIICACTPFSQLTLTSLIGLLEEKSMKHYLHY